MLKLILSPSMPFHISLGTCFLHRSRRNPFVVRALLLSSDYTMFFACGLHCLTRGSSTFFALSYDSLSIFLIVSLNGLFVEHSIVS